MSDSNNNRNNNINDNNNNNNFNNNNNNNNNKRSSSNNNNKQLYLTRVTGFAIANLLTVFSNKYFKSELQSCFQPLFLHWCGLCF